jgi:hypothetical protein
MKALMQLFVGPRLQFLTQTFAFGQIMPVLAPESAQVKSRATDDDRQMTASANFFDPVFRVFGKTSGIVIFLSSCDTKLLLVAVFIKKTFSVTS